MMFIVWAVLIWLQLDCEIKAPLYVWIPVGVVSGWRLADLIDEIKKKVLGF